MSRTQTGLTLTAVLLVSLGATGMPILMTGEKKARRTFAVDGRCVLTGAARTQQLAWSAVGWLRGSPGHTADGARGQGRCRTQ